MSTNYLVLNPNTGLYQDLGELFKQRATTDPSANLTGFKYFDPNGNQPDISTLFYPLLSGKPQLSYNTNMVSLSTGTDLTNVFAAPDFSVSGKYTYSFDAVNKYYILVFADYSTTDSQANPPNIGNGTATATLTFTANVTNVQFTLVGGGGGGGSNNNDWYEGGGGGQGGSYSYYFPNAEDTQTTPGTYNIQVGGGGAGGGTPSSQPNGLVGYNTTVTEPSGIVHTATGGAPGFGSSQSVDSSTAAARGGSGSGNGGNGGNGGADAPTIRVQDGFNGTEVAVYKNGPSLVYTYGGGGSGGPFQYEDTPPFNTDPIFGGVGGGGAAGRNSGSNAGQPYKGPNGIYYDPGITALPSTGGGGAGARGQNSRVDGGNGASGIVIVTFQNA
jgi:hypothetical protein